MKKKIISVDQCPKAIGPYSQAVSTKGFLFVSGNLPIDPKTGVMVDGGVQAQTTQVLDNIQALLKGVGLDMSDVVKTVIFLNDMNDFAHVNSIYAQYFTGSYPARSTVEVSRLPKDALIEIECIAAY